MYSMCAGVFQSYLVLFVTLLYFNTMCVKGVFLCNLFKIKSVMVLGCITCA